MFPFISLSLSGLPGSKKFKRPNLAISGLKKGKSSKMTKGQIFFKNLLK